MEQELFNEKKHNDKLFRRVNIKYFSSNNKKLILDIMAAYYCNPPLPPEETIPIYDNKDLVKLQGNENLKNQKIAERINHIH